ncbi:MAG: YafY family transcriptional regulator [Propionibacteriales bacterium]|nr:YafY family transcriptional regulator [Propionibacteriales bacterium]
MANTSSRTLRLLTLLQTHRYWPGAELADRLGVTDRTLRRDIGRLRELGYPVNSARGTEGGYQLAAGATMPPLVVDEEEAVAIVTALRSATQGAAAVLGDAPIRALAKVMQVLPKSLRKRAEAVRQATAAPVWAEAPAVDVDLLTTVAQGCRDEVRITFSYTAADGEITERRVEPHNLVPIGRRWYLVCWDLVRQDWRNFRLDRMSGQQATTIPFRRREIPNGDAAAYVSKSLRRDHGPATEVVVTVFAVADVVRPEIGTWGTVTEIDDSTCRLVMRTSDLRWCAFGLGAIGADFRIEESDELAVLIAEWGGRFSRSSHLR